MSRAEGRKLIEHAQLEHEEIKDMIRELQQSEPDDDQAWAELYEDMMGTARIHFVTEGHDVSHLINYSADATGQGNLAKSLMNV